MNEGVRQLYDSRRYPAMSHPLADPAVSTVAAWIGGLDARHPSHARVLEIGCSSGLHLIPLAMRWPQARFTGIDFSAEAIDTARELVSEAGARNIGFLHRDLRELEPPDEPFDVIIAHGFFSWVPDEVKSALLDFCARHLAPSGFATISFNLECGWRKRLSVVEKARGIQRSENVSTVDALRILREATECGSEEIAIIDDMLAKGPDLLAFDDFAPLNDPWPLDRFITAAAAAGLSWLGESDPGWNFPRDLPAEVIHQLRASHTDPLALQCAADAAAERTFRSGVLCRGDAVRNPGPAIKQLLELPVRIISSNAPDSIVSAMKRSIGNTDSCLTLSSIRKKFQETSDQKWMRDLWRAVTDGSIQLRTDEVAISDSPPEFPSLGTFRLSCLKRGFPVVDAWHRPCTFPPAQLPILTAMDGGNDLDTLRELARARHPELAFDPWIRHLAARGLFL